MFKSLLLLAALLFPLQMKLALAATNSNNQPMHIVIDPGHGGSDDGALSEKLREATLVLEVAKHLESLLKTDSQFKVSLTRQSDQFVALKDRVEFSKEVTADLYLSIHANSSLKDTTQGFEIYFANYFSTDSKSLKRVEFENQSHNNPEQEESKNLSLILNQLQSQSMMRQSHFLARKIMAEWDFKQFKSIKQAPFYVIHQAKVPALLIELGFISNPREAKILLNEESKLKMAQKIYAGLQRYKEALDKDQTVRLN